MERKPPPATPTPHVDETPTYLERAIARSDCEVTRRFLQRILGKIAHDASRSPRSGIAPPGSEP